MLLTDQFDDSFEFKDKIYNVDMSFDNILLLFELFDDEDVNELDKIFLSLRLLIIEYDNLNLESYDEALELFKYILFEFLNIDLDREDHDEDDKPQKVHDFKKDAELIYASFFAVYKLDLFELKGKLHWRKFLSLLTYLDDNSPFKQVIGYRTMKIPSPDEASKEYITHVRKMKEIHSLEDGPRDVTHVFDSLASMFKK